VSQRCEVCGAVTEVDPARYGPEHARCGKHGGGAERRRGETAGAAAPAARVPEAEPEAAKAAPEARAR